MVNPEFDGAGSSASNSGESGTPATSDSSGTEVGGGTTGVSRCDAPQVACDDMCVRTDVNVLHCGDCFQQCPMTAVCVDSNCVPDCAFGGDDL